MRPSVGLGRKILVTRERVHHRHLSIDIQPRSSRADRDTLKLGEYRTYPGIGWPFSSGAVRRRVS